MSIDVHDVDAEQAELLEEMIRAGHLIESGVPGVYGHSLTFEGVCDQLAAVISEMAATDGSERVSFPPVLPRQSLEKIDYLANFPHLAGSIFGFEGSEADARVQAGRAHAHEDWSEFQKPTDLVMVPAACYPLYPVVAARGPVPAGGVTADLGGSWVFRHEPSRDPARRQIFRQHELVCVAEPAVTTEWRAKWAQRGVELFRELGLEAQIANASDPFFGRAGRLMAASQAEEELKWELEVQIAGPTPTACASFNYHMDHFGQTWDIRLSDGAVAHTACTGFGQERIALALLHRHGMDPEQWPGPVRRRLGD